MPPGSRPLGVSPSSAALPSTTDTIYDPLTLSDLPSTTSSTDALSSGQNTVDPGTESPEAFFTAALERSEQKWVKRATQEKLAERVERLVSVVRDFAQPEIFSDEFSEYFFGWSRMFLSKPEVRFEDGSVSKFEAGVSLRLRQLKHARHNIKKKDWWNTRLWLVFLVHEVEYISQWEHIELYTCRGIDAMAAAIQMAIKYLDTARADWKRGRNIIYLMEKGGPALLLGNSGLSQSR